MRTQMYITQAHTHTCVHNTGHVFFTLLDLESAWICISNSYFSLLLWCFREQEVIIQAVKKLGVFRIEDKVSKDTTHVVYGEARRTLNVLQGMTRGCWIVSMEWVSEELRPLLSNSLPLPLLSSLLFHGADVKLESCLVFSPIFFLSVSFQTYTASLLNL